MCIPILRSSSLLTLTASLTLLSGWAKVFMALVIAWPVIWENLALRTLMFGFTALQTSMTSNPMFSPSLSQSVQMTKVSHWRTSRSKVLWIFVAYNIESVLWNINVLVKIPWYSPCLVGTISQLALRKDRQGYKTASLGMWPESHVLASVLTPKSLSYYTFDLGNCSWTGKFY